MIQSFFALCSVLVLTIPFLQASPVKAQDWRVVPAPKQIELQLKHLYVLPAQATIATTEMPVAQMFRDELKQIGSVKIGDLTTLQAKYPALIWGNSTASTRIKAAPTPPSQDEGYSLLIDAQGAVIRSRSVAGLRFGVQSLLQLVEQAAKGKWPAAKGTDWPDLAWRGFHSALRPPRHWGVKTSEEAMPIYRWMIRRLARYKYNHLCLMPLANIQLKSHPELWSHDYSRSQIRELVAFAKQRGIELFPEIKTMGNFIHKGNPQAKKLRKPIADLLEPKVDWGKMFGDMNANGKPMRANKTTFKVRDPRVLALMKDVIDDLLDLFDHPRYLHIGCDEATRFGASAAKSVNRGKMFADYVNALHDHLKQQNVQTIMWDDMLVDHKQFPHFIEAHGGSPYFTAKALKYLNKEIILAAWHYGYTVDGVYPARYPMVPYFVQKGFRVIGVPWFRTDGIANLAREIQTSRSMGFMGSSWAFHMAYAMAQGRTLRNERVTRTTRIRRELGVWAATAEAAWTPQKAADMMFIYDNVTWEQRWLPAFAIQLGQTTESSPIQQKVKPIGSKKVPRGIFALTNLDYPVKVNGQKVDLFSVPGVMGVTYYDVWQKCEPRRGKWRLSHFTDWLAQARKAGRQLNMALLAGSHVPDWALKDSGALSYPYRHLKSGTIRRNFLPWIQKGGRRVLNKPMLNIWRKSVEQFAQTMRRQPGFKKTIGYIGITGGPWSNGLEIMWGGTPRADGKAFSWGKKEDRFLIAYWKRCIDIFMDVFPDIPLGLAFTDVYGRDAKGAVRRSLAVPRAVLDYAVKQANKKKIRLIIQGFWIGAGVGDRHWSKKHPGQSLAKSRSHDYPMLKKTHPLQKLIHAYRSKAFIAFQGPMGTSSADYLRAMLQLVRKQDALFLELWHHDFAGKDAVYPKLLPASMADRNR